MNDQELTQFLARLTIADNRQIDAFVAQHWKDCIGDLEYDLAVAALITHSKTSKDYLKPAHIREGAKLEERRRWMALPIEERERRQEVAAAERSVRAIEAAGATVAEYFQHWDADRYCSWLVDRHLQFLDISDRYRDEVLGIPRSVAA